MLFWSWQDRDGLPVLMNGNGAPLDNEEQPEQIMFSDYQVEVMMCICDVVLFLKSHTLYPSFFPTQEETFAACFQGMRSATQEGIIFEDEREAWVIRYLKEHHAVHLADQ